MKYWIKAILIAICFILIGMSIGIKVAEQPKSEIELDSLRKEALKLEIKCKQLQIQRELRFIHNEKDYR